MSLTHDEETTPATFFGLGDSIHDAIFQAITRDLTLDQTLRVVLESISCWQAELHALPIQTAKRTLESMATDAERIIRSWFRWIHPSSPDRLHILDGYLWPPRAEVPFRLTPEESGTEYGVWGTVDAIFDPKPGRDLPPLILDWKSSVRRVWDTGHVGQLDFYRFGLRTPDADAALVYLDRTRAKDVLAKAGPYPGDPRVRRGIIAAEVAKQRIIETKVAPFNVGPQCRRCPVRAICPKLSTGTERKERIAELRDTLSRLEPMTELMEVAI